MKYAVWFVRLVFAGWMIPAGLNHFIPLFPQPMGNQPLSTELITALLDSHLFDMTKAVELLTGLAVLTGFGLPLMLVVCMPVSFCVWYWDTPLQGWGSTSAIYGWAVLLCNVFLCLAYFGQYRALFEARTTPKSRAQLVLAGRLLFGAWLVVGGINYFSGLLFTVPAGTTPLAVQLLAALNHSGMMGVVKGIELVAGLLLLAGAFVPLALCVVMPLSTCTLFVGAVVDHQPLGIVASLVFFALNGLLMLAFLDSYKGVLQLRGLAAGEEKAPEANYDGLYMNPMGRIPRGPFAGALVIAVAALAFYWLLVPSVTGYYAMLAILVPTVLLLVSGARGMARAT